MTYQFLNTLAIAPKELENLINRHINEAHKITETGSKYALDMAEYIAESFFEDEDTSPSIPAWRYALDLNPDFVKDPYVRSILKMDEIARVRDICNGRIVIDGVLKYLSGDLLAFLLHMIYNRKVENEGGIGDENGLGLISEDGSFHINTKVNKDAVTRLRSQLIRTGKFYTADHARLELRSDRRYGVLRSPHLSRNEQCSLRPYIPEQDDKNNIYNRYFSHLKNVIMFPYESIDAMSLGGADYDGDKVKIILDRTINSAILRGSYVLKGKNYERKLPIVEIPSLNADSEPAPEIISYKLVKRTFSNQVGLISDLAIRIGKLEYDPKNANPMLNNKCAECTLATGLEIDAVKTGIRPDLDKLKEASSSGKDYYLQIKNTIRDLTPEAFERLRISVKTETDESEGEVTIYTAKRPVYSEKKNVQYKLLFDAKFIPLDVSAATIDRLPGYLLKALSDKRKKESEPDVDDENGRSREILLFKFQLNEDTGILDTKWTKKLKHEKLDETCSSY